jgi:predicted MFS family arabinose efflux permease
MMVVLGVVGGLVVAWKLQPVVAHLKERQERSPWMHLYDPVREPRHWSAFVTMMLLATGGFMLMPFSSAFTVGNLGIAIASLPTIYLVTGLATIFVGPLVGRAADAFGKLRVFFMGTALTIVMVLIYTHLGVTSLPVVIVVNVVLFIGIFSRMIPFQALMSQVPAQSQRGSFNAINASIQQLSGGLASLAAGHIVQLGTDGRILHYDVAGYVVIATSLFTAFLLWRLQRGSENAAPAHA